MKMKKLALLLMILFASCEAPTNGVSEVDSSTFEKNVETLKNNFIKGYEEGDYDRVISVFADSIRWHGPGVIRCADDHQSRAAYSLCRGALAKCQWLSRLSERLQMGV